MQISLTTRVLIGLVLGLTAGIAISVSSSEVLTSIPSWVEPVGSLVAIQCQRQLPVDKLERLKAGALGGADRNTPGEAPPAIER